MPVIGLASEPTLVQVVPAVDDIAHFDTALPEVKRTRLLFATETGVRFDADSHEGGLCSVLTNRGILFAPCSAPPLAPKGNRAEFFTQHDSRDPPFTAMM